MSKNEEEENQLDHLWICCGIKVIVSFGTCTSCIQICSEEEEEEEDFWLIIFFFFLFFSYLNIISFL